MQQLNSKRLTRLLVLPLLVTAITTSYAFAPAPVYAAHTTISANAMKGLAASFNNAVPGNSKPSFSEEKKHLYDTLNLKEAGLSRKVYEMALRGMEKLKRSDRVHSNILTIADFSKSSIEKRLFVIDLDNEQLLYCTWVAHGRNSGKEMANSFSNKPRTRKSSLGFYVTGQPYNGSNGYSLKLLGMESGFNSNAFVRGIVLHGADYVNTDFISSQGYIGRSQGCPAVAPDVAEDLINTIKEGSCLFIYHPSITYIKRSTLLR